MSKAPETIYILSNPEDPRVFPHAFFFTERQDGSEIAYVRGDIAYGYASEVERLRSVLKQIARNADILTTNEIEHIARDALTKQG